VFDRLPEYPWQKLNPYREIASAHPDGLIDLSVGSPVDPTPEVVQKALLAASNAPGYPSTWGSPELRTTIAQWYARRRGVAGLSVDQVMPTIGSKEFISWLPVLLGLGPGDVVVQPEIRYTAYEVGAALAGAEILASDNPALWPKNTRLIWLNSPANPHGAVMSKQELTLAVRRARELGAVLVNDECYAEMGWEAPYDTERIPCVLDPEVVGPSLEGVLSIYSLSKQSNLAGYRAAFAAGDEKLIRGLVNLRMHAGMMTPYPVQQAMIAALNDDAHVAEARATYRGRRIVLLEALRSAGFEVVASEAGLYLWATDGGDCWSTVERLARRGILVVPGDFYGERGQKFIRVSLTATDEQIYRAAKRML
jgi:succinyldiaminopimelate transaminase